MTSKQQEGVFFDSTGGKRRVQALVRTYPETGSYVFIDLFKKNGNGEFSKMQHIGLTLDEYKMLLQHSAVVAAIQPPPPPVTPAQQRGTLRLQPVPPTLAVPNKKRRVFSRPGGGGGGGAPTMSNATTAGTQNATVSSTGGGDHVAASHGLQIVADDVGPGGGYEGDAEAGDEELLFYCESQYDCV